MSDEGRIKIHFDDELENFNLDQIKKKNTQKVPKPKNNIEKLSADAGFKSRRFESEPKPKKNQRRHRTGRNAQINIKATPETIEKFVKIADRHNWVLGEALAKAVELMEQEYQS